MKIFRNIMLSILLCLPLFTLSASADMGPKTSVEISFEGLEDETYYVTLLGTSKSGPWDSNEEYYEDDPLLADIANKFNSFQDKDGYYFLGYFEDCSQTHQFVWGYFPPENFKILIYLPEEDLFILSNDIYEQYAFTSSFKVTITNHVMESVVSAPQIIKEIISFFCRVISTIAIELLVALIFGFRKITQLKFIAFINVITQIILNLVLSYFIYFEGFFTFCIVYCIAEFIVSIGEGIFYQIKLKTEDMPSSKPFFYSLAANCASFIIGLIIVEYFTGLL